MSRPDYVVVSENVLTNRKGEPVTLTCYWYGPDHGWGTTGSTNRDDGSVAVFPHRVAAEDALRKVFGTLAAAKRRGYKAVADRPHRTEVTR